MKESHQKIKEVQQSHWDQGRKLTKIEHLYSIMGSRSPHIPAAIGIGITCEISL